jgi:rubrerythrin
MDKVINYLKEKAEILEEGILNIQDVLENPEKLNTNIWQEDLQESRDFLKQVSTAIKILSNERETVRKHEHQKERSKWFCPSCHEWIELDIKPNKCPKCGWERD